jgi:hypothetical protein
MCMYLAGKHSDNYEKVAQLYSLKVQKRVPTIKTLAIASEVGLGGRQLQKLRQYLKLEGVLLELSPKVINKVDEWFESGPRPTQSLASMNTSNLIKIRKSVNSSTRTLTKTSVL